nr:putative Ig domain-containing protein [Acidovorax sp. CCYZU-2555]
MEPNARGISAPPQAIFFVFDNLPDWQTLAAAVPDGAELVVLDGSQDGLDQIAAHLQGRSDISALHILSHGEAGRVQLGSSSLGVQEAQARADLLERIGSSLTADGDILLYGCDVASGAAGQQFIEQLARLTQADVAASVDATGSALRGGNWQLEAQAGEVALAHALGAQDTLQDYAQLLAVSYSTANNPLSAVSTQGQSTIVGDFDSDGDVDVLTYNAPGNTSLLFYRNDGSGIFTAVDSADASSPFRNLALADHFYNSETTYVADFDNDGDLDIWDYGGDDHLLNASPSVNGPGFYLRNDGGIYLRLALDDNPLKDVDSFKDFAIDGDFDSDGDEDVLAVKEGGLEMEYFQNSGSGIFTQLAYALSPFSGVAIADQFYSASNTHVADFDGDGDLDIWDATGDFAHGGTPVYLQNNGGTYARLSAAASPLKNVALTDNLAYAIVGDFDTDGDVDVLAFKSDGLTPEFLRNNGSGEFTTVALADSPFAGINQPYWNLPETYVADFDNDGDVDIWDYRGQTAGIYTEQLGAPPNLSSATPVDNSIDVHPGAALVLQFDEVIATVGLGSIHIYRSSDDALIRSIKANSLNVTGTGSTTLTITQPALLADLTDYYLLIDNNAFGDVEGRMFPGISSKTQLNFTTGVANVAPTATNLSQTVAYTEDPGASVALGDIVITEPDSGDTLTATLTLSNAAAGALTTGTFGAATSSYAAGVWTVSGTLADVNAALASVAFTPAAHWDQNITITTRVRDAANAGPADGSIALNVTAVNDNPTLANPVQNQNATEDLAFNFQFAANTFADVDTGDTLVYSAQLVGGAALPTWLNFNAATRSFTGTPANGDVGTLSIEVMAKDASNATVTDSFDIVVANTNDAPTVANPIADRNATEDAAFSFQFAVNTFIDVDVGDTLSYSAQLAGGGGLPAWLAFDAVTRTFSGTPANGDVGTVGIDVIAADGNGTSVTETFNIVVANTNDAPTVANIIPDQNATEDTAFSFAFGINTFEDVDVGDTLSYSAQLASGGALPTWLAFDAVTCTFSGTPANGDVGTLSIEVSAKDASNVTATDTFVITVANTNDAPTVANVIPDQNATQDAAFSFAFDVNTFADVDVGDTLSYSAQLAGGAGLPTWLVFDAVTRTFSGTPANGDVGTLSIEVSAKDASNVTVTDTFDIVVANTNDAPTVANPIADQNATEDTAFSFAFDVSTFEDVDVGDTLSYSAQSAGGAGLPTWLLFDAVTRTFSGTPTNGDVGTLSIEVIAQDASGDTVTEAFAITVANTNDAPTVANPIADKTATEDTAFVFQFAANAFADVDVGDTLSYSAQLAGGGALPTWLAFDAGSRTFSGTPANGDVGTLSIEVSAKDASNVTVTDTFDIVVANTNDAPTVANPIADQNATEDTAFSFAFDVSTFEDVDAGDTLSYSAQLAGGAWLPTWLAFDPITRTFSGTPDNAAVGTLSIDVIANDGNGGLVTETFDIVVANTNDAPTLAVPIPDSSTTAGRAFNFQIAANAFLDVDVGDILAYTTALTGGGALPAWLSFNAATRTFSGTPGPADVGTLSIDVSAGDGHGGTVTDTFSLLVMTAPPPPVTPPNPPAPAPVDGVPVTSAPGDGGTTIITVPVVAPTRPDSPDSPNAGLADIPLVKGSDGHTILQVSVPVGVALQAQGLTAPVTGNAAAVELDLRIERAAGGDAELINSAQVFLAALNPSVPLNIQTITATVGANFNQSTPFVISGSAVAGDGAQAVILDARALPSGTTIQVDNIDFIAVVGNVRLVGGAGQNVANGDGGAQYIVLGPDDDIIHGGGGNDTVGSKGGDDQVYGDAGNDTVFGGAGNDLLSGGSGSDKLNGGTGFDVALQEGKRSDYSITLDGTGIKLTHIATSVADWLVDVEQVRFETGPILTVAHSAAEEAAAFLFQQWMGRDLTQAEGAVIQTLDGLSALQVADLFAQVFPQQAGGKTAQQLLEGMETAGAIRVDAARETAYVGDAGNNTFTPPMGLAWTVDGGAGIDTIVIPATLAQMHVEASAAGHTLQRMTDGAMLELVNVERVTLSDTQLALDLDGHAGEAARLIGAVGGPALLDNKPLVGEVIRALDAGISAQSLAQLGLQLLGANTSGQVTQLLWTNVVGSAPTPAQLQPFIDMMAQGVTGGELAVLAGNLDLNAVRIDLVGLADTGIEFA